MVYGPLSDRLRSQDHDGVWHLVKGTRYTFHALLFDDAGTAPGERPGSRRAIYVTDNLEVAPTLEADRGWEEISADHQSVSATPTQLGPGVIAVAFSGAKPCGERSTATHRDSPLTMAQKIHVHENVSITLPWSELVLPRPQELSTPNKHPLKATGGSSTYLWTSTDAKIATVDADGIVTALSEGTATIRCQDRWNAENWDTRTVIVSTITSMSLARAPKEVEIGSTLQLGAVLRDEVGRQFDSCFPVAFDMQVASQSIFSTTTTERSTANLAYGRFSDPLADPAMTEAEACDPPLDVGRKACFVMDLLGQAEGESEVSLTMSAGKGLSLSAKLTYAAFTPLVILAPTERKAVATIGCESQVSFRGGPRWLATKEIIAVEPAAGTAETAVEVQGKHTSCLPLLVSCGSILTD